MKKFCSYLLIFVSLLCCSFFSACKNKYKNLDISFVLNGEKISSLQLVLGDEKYESQVVTIQFDGLGKNEIGEIEIYSPEDLVSVLKDDIKIDGDKCTAKITAVKSGLAGHLTVLHSASNKSATIDLSVQQNTTSLEVIENDYYITTPISSESSKEFILPINELVKLDAEATNKVFLKKSDSSKFVDEIEPIYEDNEKTLIKGFKLETITNSAVDVDLKYEFYPVSYIKDYEAGTKTFNDKEEYKITIHFVQQISGIKLIADEEIFDDYLGDEDIIHLIDSSKSVSVEDRYGRDKVKYFNEICVWLQAQESKYVGDISTISYKDWWEDDLWKAIYNLEVKLENESDNSGIFLQVNNNKAIVKAGYVSGVKNINISLVPKVAGDLETYTKTLKIQGESTAENIILKQLNQSGEFEEIEDYNNIPLFDSYDFGTKLGAEFLLNVASESFGEVYSDFAYAKLIIDPTLINFKGNVFDKGNNPITNLRWTDAGNATKTLNLNDFSLLNKYLLDIYYKGEPIKYYFNESTGKLESEFVDSSLKNVDNILNVKYVTNTSGSESGQLKLGVQNVYIGDLEYLKNYPVQECFKTIVFENQDAILSLSADFGEYVDPEYTTIEQNLSQDRTIYLNVKEAKNYLFHFNKDYLTGVNGKPIYSTNFVAHVVSNSKTNPLLLQFRNSAGGVNQSNEKIELTFENKDNPECYVYLDYNNVDVGEYFIEFLQPKASSKALLRYRVVVLGNLTADDLRFEFDKTNLLNNKDGDNYIYQDIMADYLVGAGSVIQFVVDINDVVEKSDVVKGLSFSLLFDDENIVPTEYVEYTNEGNKVLVTFKKGSFVENTYKSIKLCVDVEYVEYNSPLTEGARKNLTIESESFFIYEVFDQTKLVLNHTNVTIYNAGKLSAYFKDKSVLTLSLDVENQNLLNYLQAFRIRTGFIGQDGKKINWSTNGSGVTVLGQSENQITLQFNSSEPNVEFEIVATVCQFGKLYSAICKINLKDPVLTDRIILDEPGVYFDQNQDAYLNLKKSQEMNIVASNFKAGETVTNPGFVCVVVNDAGVAVDDIVHIDQQNNVFLKFENTPADKQLYLLVISKDVLKSKVEGIKSGFNNLNNLLMDGKTPYLKIRLIVSDGTKDNPYLLKTSADFWELNENESLRSKDTYFKLMNDINLFDTTAKIESIKNFGANITTDQNKQFALTGIKLNNEFKNLFVENSGNIQNVKFVVNFGYNGTFDGENIGVFGTNTGELKNVSVQMSGSSTINGNSIVFGGLVGRNFGEIIYTQGNYDETTGKYEFDKVNGATGNITINGGNILFGGLVGCNLGKIEGYENPVPTLGENTVNPDFELSFDNIGQMSSVYITTKNLGENSAIGGVVGKNEFVCDNDNNVYNGTVSHAVTSVVIDAEGSNNIGGLIGWNETKYAFDNNNEIILPDDCSIGYVSSENESKLTSLTIKKTATVKDIISRAVVKGKNNVGGLAGLDSVEKYDANQAGNNTNRYGSLFEKCFYQITSGTGVSGGNNIGGLVGQSTHGIFKNCSVMSYKWDYLKPTTMFAKDKDGNQPVADIEGDSCVGGLVGLAIGSESSLTGTDFVNRVVVTYSSVNAFVKANSENVSVGGIYSTNTANIMFNSYFLGRIDGNTTSADEIVADDNKKGLYLENNNKSIYNHVYSVVFKIDDSDVINVIANKKGLDNGIKDIKDGELLNTNPYEYWGQHGSLNGGYIFVSSDENGNNPLFEIAPTEIKANVSDKYLLTEKKDDKNASIRLNYYDFGDVSVGILEGLNKNYNTFNLLNNNDDGIFSFDYAPKGISSLTLVVSSDNKNVVSILSGGKIQINGTGKAVLRFESVLNPNVFDEVDVFVTLPVGEKDNFKLLGNNTIAKGTTSLFDISTFGMIKFEGKDYNFKTLSNLGFEVISNDSNINDYIQVGTNEFKKENDNYKTIIDEQTPVFITAKEKYDKTLKLTFIPFITMNGVCVYLEGYEKEIEIHTRTGATEISLDAGDFVVYPNDKIGLTLRIKTDIEYTENKYLDADETIRNDYYYINLFNKEKTTNGFLFDDNGELKTDRIKVVEFSEIKNGIQIIRFEIDLRGYSVNEDNQFDQQRIWFELENGRYSIADITILSQRIDKLEIKNLVYNSLTEKYEQQSVLKPASQTKANGSVIVVDIVPNNGVFTHLEIVDITGNEEIQFIQLDGEGGEANNFGNSLFDIDKPSQDGLGIRLEPVGKATTFYVSAQISRTYSSKPHTIEVRAYYEGRLLSRSKIVLEVKMLPVVKAEYRLPDNSVKESVENDKSDMLYLANGSDATFFVSTANANGDLEWNVEIGNGKEFATTSDFEIRENENGFYVLKCLNYNSANLGKVLATTFKTTNIADNGDFEQAEARFEFTLTNFVIHNLSVKPSAGGVIYGHFEQAEAIEFFFDKNDISYYDNGSVNQTIYSLDKFEKDSDGNITETGALGAIGKILKAINDPSSGYLALNFGKDANGNYLTSLNNWKIQNNELKQDDVEMATLKENRITIKSAVPSELRLSIKFNIELNDDNWSIENTGTTTISKDYTLNFIAYTTAIQPKLVANEKDFLNMASGDNVYYILGRDLVLEDYTPLDINISEFDGNGHTITINSFANFTSADIEAGLFAEIKKNMVVKNLVVKYSNSDDKNFGRIDRDNNSQTIKNVVYNDLCNNNNVDFSSARFGGICAINNGIITNCSVEGTFALKAGVVQNKVNSSNSVDFYIGGLVAENAGFITNSNAKVDIFAQANVGLFAFSNTGKISSSFVNSQEINTFSYGTTAKSFDIYASAFVVRNSGQISMSYTNVGKLSSNISSGFVYSNSAKINDCYSIISSFGEKHNEFYGFVNTNTSTISHCYTFINNGVQPNVITYMFTKSASNIENCAEIVANNNIPSVDGVERITVIERTNKAKYENLGFVFGDNENAVWKKSEGKLPSLVVCEEIVENKNNMNGNVYKSPEGDVVDGKYEYYYGLQTIKRKLDTEKSDENNKVYYYEIVGGNYGTKYNPFIIHNVDLLLSGSGDDAVYGSCWDSYFTEQNSKGYFRIVSDIDLDCASKNPTTANLIFSGNIQGNCMTVSNYIIKSDIGLESIGLFKQFENALSPDVESAVRNLKIQVNSIWASKTKAVGALVGIAQDFNLFNIEIDSNNTTIIGGNSAGGVAGIVRGKFTLDGLTSNINVNVAYNNVPKTYSVYESKNNNQQESSNLGKVYYAGSIVGILDGYDSRLFNLGTRDIVTGNYFDVKNISTNGKIVVIGDSVGAAFGFVGERVKISNLLVKLTGGSLEGNHYAGVAVGENRGIVTNSNIKFENVDFDNSQNAVAGLVGFNLGGFVENSFVNGEIEFSRTNGLAGGVIGVNVNGYLKNVVFDGMIKSKFSGAVVGAEYSANVLQKYASGKGALSNDSKNNVLKTVSVNYKENGNLIDNRLTSVGITLNTVNNFAKSSNYFYTQNNRDQNGLAYRVFGLYSALSDNDNIMIDTANSTSNVYFKMETKAFDDNSFEDFANKEMIVEDGYLIEKPVNYEGDSVTIKGLKDGDNIITIKYSLKDFNKNVLAYTTGVKTESYKLWDGKTYGLGRIFLSA